MQFSEIELDGPPRFEIGQKVRLRKLIRNDGTFPGKEVGEPLAKKGEVGYVVTIGTYLQSAYIYAVHFLQSNYIIGCRFKELELFEPELIPEPATSTPSSTHQFQPETGENA
ncbi:MAG: nitrogen fixation protein NifZ [Elainella sp. Prado103]|jgi:nitrogen fixation protein NifZ|nr:nitrogen fixation protein NifZ [Elainella sp. Prado103]